MIPPFPPVDADAPEQAGTWLLSNISHFSSLAGRTRVTSRNVLSGPHKWDGESAQRWQVVVDARIADLGVAQRGLTVLGEALVRLGRALRSARQEYDRALARLRAAPPEWQESITRSLQESVDRAEAAIRQAAEEFGDAGELVDQITARGARNRMPGAPPGTNRQQASLAQLAFLFGSVTANRKTGLSFEDRVRADIGMKKNTTRIRLPGWRTYRIPDAMDTRRIVEIKDTWYMWNKTQIQNEMEEARRSGREFRFYLPKGAEISENLAEAMENSPNANWYTEESPGVYRSGKDGLLYRHDPDGALLRVPPGKEPPPDTDDGSGSGSPPKQPPVQPGGTPAPGGKLPPGTVPLSPLAPGVRIPIWPWPGPVLVPAPAL